MVGSGKPGSSAYEISEARLIVFASPAKPLPSTTASGGISGHNFRITEAARSADSGLRIGNDCSEKIDKRKLEVVLAGLWLNVWGVRLGAKLKGRLCERDDADASDSVLGLQRLNDSDACRFLAFASKSLLRTFLMRLPRSMFDAR